MSKLKSFLPLATKSWSCLLYASIRRSYFRHRTMITNYSPAFQNISRLLLPIGMIINPMLQSVSNYETEQKITQLIAKAEDFLSKNKMDEAKTHLEKALQLAERDQAFGSITYLCDLLSSIAFISGGIVEAEIALVNSIEKLLQLGFDEDHNSIVRFKLKLARLYQIIGSREMAEYGYKDCIRVLDTKMERTKKSSGKDGDSNERSTNDSNDKNATNEIYINALFWYGKLLQEFQDLQQAKIQYKKCLHHVGLVDAKNKDRPVVTPSQKMVLLFNMAEVTARLKEYDNALGYLFDAIEICISEVPDNPELPFYVVQVGRIFTEKGFFENAKSWCEAGVSLATKENNVAAKTAANECLERLDEMLINTK